MKDDLFPADRLSPLLRSGDSLSAGNSSSFTVLPGTATLLVFTTQPAGATAGASFVTQPVIHTRDAYGNNSTVGLGASVPVTLAKIGSGTLQGTLGYDIGTSHGNGTITGIGLRFDTAGSIALRATGSGLADGDSGSFTVSPASASKLVFTTQPVNTGAGVAISPSVVVTVQDPFDNTVTGDNSTAVTISGTTFMDSSTLTVSAGSGVATFSNLKPRTIGTGITLKANGGSLTEGISAPFDVTATSKGTIFKIR